MFLLARFFPTDGTTNPMPNPPSPPGLRIGSNPRKAPGGSKGILACYSIRKFHGRVVGVLVIF